MEEPARDAAHAWARKIRPQYARGEPVNVAVAMNQAEAELIAGVLLEAGIPSTQRRSGAADLPDFLAAGPRYVMVPSSAEPAARELLGTEATVTAAVSETSPRPLGVRALALFIVVCLLAAALATTLIVVFA